MPSKLYVGNLAYAVTNDDLQQLFSQVGQVQSVAIITDKFSGQSKGFGFVEMASADDAAKAIQQFNETELKGRNIKVNEAKPRESSFGWRRRRQPGRWRRRRWKSRPRSLVNSRSKTGAGRAPPPLFLAHANIEPDGIGRFSEPMTAVGLAGATSWKNVAENSFVGRSNRTRNSAGSNASPNGRLRPEWPRIRTPTWPIWFPDRSPARLSISISSSSRKTRSASLSHGSPSRFFQTIVFVSGPRFASMLLTWRTTYAPELATSARKSARWITRMRAPRRRSSAAI